MAELHHDPEDAPLIKNNWKGLALLVAIMVTTWVALNLISYVARGRPAPPTPHVLAMATDNSFSSYTDPATGCQYLVWYNDGGSGVVTRLKSDGTPLCTPSAPAR